MVAEVRVHYNNEVSSSELKAVDICGSKAKLAFTRLQDNVLLAIGSLELLCNLECTIWGAIINYDNFPVKLAK